MKSLGAKIDMVNDTIELTRIEQIITLKEAPSGHYQLDLMGGVVDTPTIATKELDVYNTSKSTTCNCGSCNVLVAEVNAADNIADFDIEAWTEGFR